MFDDTSPFDVSHAAGAPSHQRTKGSARCAFKIRDGKTVLDDLMQSGSFKVRFPHVSDGRPEAVLLNTAGGLTGGDRLNFEGTLAPGADAVFTTQAGERAYRALYGEAKVSVRLKIGAGARAAWLPQETILFDGARLLRTFDADLDADATLLAHETVIFGRTAMGETVRHGLFGDFWRVRRAGKLAHADAIRAEGGIDAVRACAATLNGAVAMASILYVGGDAAARAPELRDLAGSLSSAFGRAALSAWSGKTVIRAVAADGEALRKITMPILTALQDGRGLPRVWTM